MPGAWIDIVEEGGTRREPLREGLTRIGGPGLDIVVDGAGDDQLQLWDSPARVVFVGGGEPPTRGGVRLEEAPLAPGDRFQWRGLAFVFGRDALEARPAPLTELPLSPPPPAPCTVPPPEPPASLSPAPVGGPAGVDERAWRRLRAGLLIDLALADRRAVRRWQETVLAGTFDADACARDIEATSAVPADDPRPRERAGRLLRDFLMAPYQAGLRGAGRRAREKARGGLAFLVVQGMALLIFLFLAAVALVVARFKGADVNGLLDLILMRK